MGFSLAIHGGAGTIRADGLTPAMRDAFHAGLRAALAAGHDVLAAGRTALDAVTASVMALEDDPLFNAGRGSVFTADGRHEMDAAVMDGATRAAGAVASICGPRNPILAARAVLAQGESVLLVGAGAEDLCRGAGLSFEPSSYFDTDRRRAALAAELARRTTGGTVDEATRHGTVGAVARDAAGHVAAATSTGGMTAKPPGRVGDSPIIGAGTFADDASCAISCTGHGEFFIRWAAAHEVSARMRHRGEGLEAAAEAVVAELARVGGSGGLIAVDAAGRVALPFNSEGMYRGQVTQDGVFRTAIHREGERLHG